MRSMRGMNRYISGTGSELMGVARPPSHSTASAIARAEPKASASGLSWPMASTRRAERSRSTASSGTDARSAAVTEVSPTEASVTTLRASPRGWSMTALGRRLGDPPDGRRHRERDRRIRAELLDRLTVLQLVDDAQQPSATLGAVVLTDV